MPGIEGRFAWMLGEVDWEGDRDRDFDFVHALERELDCASERDHTLFVSTVADTSVVDDGEGGFIGGFHRLSLFLMSDFLHPGPVERLSLDSWALWISCGMIPFTGICTVESTGAMALDYRRRTAHKR
ncbi:hypothetical protein MRX96_007417 [Rhipicephalus microplus]